MKSEKLKISKERIYQEILKCGKDPVYFINNYCKLSHPMKGLIPFSLFDFQEQLIHDLMDHRFNIILKARQLGISWVTAAYATWLMEFHREKSILAIATKFATAQNIVKKVKHMLENMPEWLRISEITVDNRTSIELNNGSRIIASSTSGTAARSESLSLLIVDEAAHVDGIDELWAGLFPALSVGGRCVILSSPCGVGSFFHEKFVGAENGSNDFHPTTLPWYVHPERDKNWFDKETRNMSKREIAQELECLTGDTKIITKSGFTRIQDVKVGDEVLTHTGTFKKVVRTFSKIVPKEEMVSISTPMSRKNPIKITKNHPILTATRAKKTTQNIMEQVLNDDFNQEWLSSSEIRGKFKTVTSRDVPMFLCGLFPKLSDSVFAGKETVFDLAVYNELANKITETHVRHHRQGKSTKRFIDLDYDTGKILGLYLSEGFRDSKRTSFAFHIKETYLVDFVKSWAEKYNINCSIHHRVKSNCTIMFLCNRFLSLLIGEFISGKKFDTKLLKERIYDTSKEFVRGIVDGTWLGDGLHEPGVRNVLRLSNEKLIYQMRTLMSSFDLLTRVSFSVINPKWKQSVIDGRTVVRNKQDYYIELNGVESKTIDNCTANGVKYKKGQRTKLARNIWWGRPKFEEPTDLEPFVTVYNIEVDEDNSYVCENLIVHNCSFNQSGETVFDAEDLEYIKANLQEPLRRSGFDRNLWVWHEYDQSLSYALVADVARGDGTDFSTFQILEIKSGKQVAEYQGKVAVDVFAKVIYDAGKEYGNCMAVVENNTVGYATLQKLIDLGYPNIYYSQKGTHDYIDADIAESSKGAVPGFSMTVKTRPWVVSKAEELIRNRVVKIYSKRLYHEMTTFIWHNGKPQAVVRKIKDFSASDDTETTKSYNDDLVMAFAIACWIKDTVFTINQRELDYKKAMLSAMRVSSTTFSSTIQGQVAHRQNMTTEQINKARQFSWLLKG